NETANEPKRFADGFDRRSKASGGCERATTNDPRTTILLSFRELESRTGAFLTVFLTFFLARVACDQPRFFQCRTQVRVEFHQCTRDAVTNRSGLSGRTAARNVDENVEFRTGFRKAKRLTNDHLQSFVREIRREFTPVDGDAAAARTQVNACGRCFSAACAVILNICHNKKSSDLKFQIQTNRSAIRNMEFIILFSPEPVRRACVPHRRKLSVSLPSPCRASFSEACLLRQVR